jgi:hypothetical protein
MMRIGAVAGVGVLVVAWLFFAGTGGERLLTSERAEQTSASPSVRAASFVVDCAAPGRPISPLIYGVGGIDDPWPLGITARRWGGNPTTRYNWEANASNAAKDWFFRNGGDPRSTYDTFLEENKAYGVSTALTVPMIGWVAKDTTSYSFPVSVFGPQQATAPESADMGNGVAPDGRPIAPGSPTRTSVASSPESIARWVQQIREKDRTRGRTVDSYILDNEPMLWNSTHRDVHPEPTTYDELLEKTIAYASAIRKHDPEAKIAGPAEWGWQAYHYSAKDVAAGLTTRPDRRSHNDEPLIPWYLRRLREHEQKSGLKLLDILDVHFYPMGDGIGITTSGKTDPATSALRLRSTRSLWDPTYKDESWINEQMRVLPLLREWVQAHHPGLGISIGEWNFGAETHMSGGLAVAEVLGRFGLEGVTSAYYWAGPVERSPAFWAFRAYRNYDGMKAHFLDISLPVTGRTTLASLFASRATDGQRLALVLLNLSALTPLAPAITIQGCGAVSSPRAFTYTGGEGGFDPILIAASGDTLKLSAAAYSITVIDASVATPVKAKSPESDGASR